MITGAGSVAVDLAADRSCLCVDLVFACAVLLHTCGLVEGA